MKHQITPREINLVKSCLPTYCSAMFMNHKGTKNTKNARKSGIRALDAWQIVRCPLLNCSSAAMLVGKQSVIPRISASFSFVSFVPSWFDLRAVGLEHLAHFRADVFRLPCGFLEETRSRIW